MPALQQLLPPGRLAVSRRPGPIPMLAVAGELDLATAAWLRRQLRTELVGCRALVLDLTDLAFLDVAGARLLQETLVAAAEAGVALALVGLSPLARCTAQVVGDRVAAVHHRSVSEALRELDEMRATRAASAY